AAYQSVDEKSVSALAQHVNLTHVSLAIEGQEHNLFAVVIPEGSGGYKRSRRLSTGGPRLVREKLDGGVHLRPQKHVWIFGRIQYLYFHLHRGFLPIGLGRNLRNFAVVGLVGISIRGDDTLLFGTQPGKIRLRDVELNLEIVQIRQRHYRSLWSAGRCAGKLRRN